MRRSRILQKSLQHCDSCHLRGRPSSRESTQLNPRCEEFGYFIIHGLRVRLPSRHLVNGGRVAQRQSSGATIRSQLSSRGAQRVGPVRSDGLLRIWSGRSRVRVPPTVVVAVRSSVGRAPTLPAAASSRTARATTTSHVARCVGEGYFFTSNEETSVQIRLPASTRVSSSGLGQSVSPDRPVLELRVRLWLPSHRPE